jgi:hypothetical protein
MTENIQRQIDKIYRECLQTAEMIEKVSTAVNSVYSKVNIDTYISTNNKLHESVKTINELLVELNRDFITQVEYIIEKHYNLRFVKFELGERHIKLLNIEPIINPEIIINNITKQCGDFLDAGVQTMLKSERYSIEKATQMNNRVDIPSVYSFDDFNSRWNQKNAIRAYGSLHVFYKLLSYFDNGSLSRTPFNTIDLDNIHLSDVYRPVGLTKLEGIRFYKNGKLTLYFIDKATAEQFLNFIQAEKVNA